jgi:hypothetical protein
MKTVFARARQRFAAANDLDSQLDGVEELCREVLDANEDVQASRYAVRTMTYTAALREAMEAGNMKGAVLAALRVGASSERLRAYLEAPWIAGRRRALDALQAESAPDERLVREVLERFDALRELEPGRPLGSIERQLVRDFGAPLRTLQRWRARRE